MSNDKFRQFAAGAREAVGPQYDSDEDLDEETRKKIKESGPSTAQKIRDEAWDKAGMYSKTMKVLKGAWSGDKRKPRE